MNITTNTTLNDLIHGLGYVEKQGDKRPTAKALRETAGEPVAKTEDGIITVYANGYAVYSSDVGTTVLWVPGCTSFTYRFDPLLDTEKEYQRETDEIPEETFLVLHWEVALSIIGEHQVEENMMNRKSDRRGQRSDMKYDCDEEEAQEDEEDSGYHKLYHWQEDRFAESPEAAVIRKESQQELLDKLTDKQREAFLLYYRDGFNQQEIADMLKISRLSVLHRLEGALKKIKKLS